MLGPGGTNGTLVGNQTGTNVDRSGVQWLRFKIESAGMLTYDTHGRVFDRARSNALYYYFPSLMVNCAGDMVTGFSGSSTTTYIGAYFTYRPRGGVVLDPPRLIRSGVTNYVSESPWWGDHSATTLDPTDDATFWTVQEFAGFGDPDLPWATVIARMQANPQP